MSKIKELINDENVILVFDVDGVLARIEYGEYNHYAMTDDLWDEAIKNGESFYKDEDAFETMREYVKTRDMNRVYVCTRVMNELEAKMKVDFLKRNYNILESHIYYVYKNEEKLDILNKVKDLNKNVDDNHIVLVDDTVDVLTYVMTNSNYATIHSSSFIK